MTLEDALVTRLSSHDAIKDVTGDRIDFGRTFAAFPAISLQIVSDPRPQHFKGFQRVRATEVQIDIWARTVEVGAPLRELVIAALVVAADIEGVRFQRALITNVRSGFERQQSGGSPAQRIGPEIHRTSIDITFTHDA